MRTNGAYLAPKSGLFPMRPWTHSTGSLLSSILSSTFPTTHVKRTKNTTTVFVWRKVLPRRWAVDPAGIGGVTKGGTSAPSFTNTGGFSFHCCDNCFRRELGDFYIKFFNEELDSIRESTGCRKPCRYMEYKIEGEGLPTSFKSEHPNFSLLASSRSTNWKVDQRWMTMVAGTLWLRERSFFTLPPPWSRRWAASSAFSSASPSWPSGMALSGWRRILFSSNLTPFLSSTLQ